MRKSHHGFTLIELLVVIAIIGLLSSIVMGSLASAKTKAKDAKRIVSFKQIQTALELYYQTNGTYPVMIAYITTTYESQWTGLFTTTMAPYISSLPTEYTPNGFVYSSTNSGQKYGLAVGLETSSAIMANDGGYYAAYFELGPSPRECSLVSKDWWGSPAINCP